MLDPLIMMMMDISVIFSLVNIALLEPVIYIKKYQIDEKKLVL